MKRIRDPDAAGVRIVRRLANALDGWPSGRRRTLGKRVGGQLSRGFGSHAIRHTLNEFNPLCNVFGIHPNRRPNCHEGHRGPTINEKRPADLSIDGVCPCRVVPAAPPGLRGGNAADSSLGLDEIDV